MLNILIANVMASSPLGELQHHLLHWLSQLLNANDDYDDHDDHDDHELHHLLHWLSQLLNANSLMRSLSGGVAK